MEVYFEKSSPDSNGSSPRGPDDLSEAEIKNAKKFADKHDLDLE